MTLDKENILEQIFDSGFASTEIELIPGKLKAKFKTLTGEDLLALSNHMNDVKGSQMLVLQQYSVYKLTFALTQYKSQDLTKLIFEERYSIVSALSSSIIDKLLQEHTKFEKFVNECLKLEEIEDHFFGMGGSPEKLEQSPVVTK